MRELARYWGFTVYEYIKNYYSILAPLSWAKTMRGVANFYDGDVAINILTQALNITQHHKNIIETAFIKNSLGFIFLRNSNIFKALECFSTAYDILKKNKTHEISFALNNRAICYLLQGKYENALLDLLEALLWNTSPYAYYTINTQLCACYMLLGNYEDARRIMDLLEAYLHSSKIEDDVVTRKIKINLGIMYARFDESIMSQSYFDSISLKSVLGTSSEYRFCTYTKRDTVSTIKDNEYYKNIYFEPWILVYGHD